MDGSILAYIAAGVAGMGLLAWRFDGRGSDTYGSARWASVWKAFRKGLFREKGLRVGDWTGQLSLFYDGIHAITFGQSGSWKAHRRSCRTFSPIRTAF